MVKWDRRKLVNTVGETAAQFLSPTTISLQKGQENDSSTVNGGREAGVVELSDGTNFPERPHFSHRAPKLALESGKHR